MPVIINEFEVIVEPNQPGDSSIPQPGGPQTGRAAGHGSRQRSSPEPVFPQYGVYPALVIDIVDPHSQGRLKVSLPWALDAGGSPYVTWARLATLIAGDQRGSWFVPDVGDEVLVVFESGDPSKPYVIGSLWNGQDAPPARMDSSGQNHLKLLRTRSGLQISLDDTAGSERIELATPGGQKVSMKDSPDSIEIIAGGSKIVVKDNRIEIESDGKLVIDASMVELNASILTVNAAMAKFSGVVQTDTLIANSVVSASYTPGAGNIW